MKVGSKRAGVGSKSGLAENCWSEGHRITRQDTDIRKNIDSKSSEWPVGHKQVKVGHKTQEVGHKRTRVGHKSKNHEPEPIHRLSLHYKEEKMEIRKATLADARGIARVHVDSWLATYKGIVPDAYLNQLNYDARERLWSENLKADNNFVAVNEGGEIIGFADGGRERTGKYAAFEGELYSIYILPHCQGQGIGAMLLAKVVDDLKEKGMNSLLVWVLEDNRSRSFYEKLGGQEVDRQKIIISGKELTEIAYGWEDCSQLKKQLS